MVEEKVTTGIKFKFKLDKETKKNLGLYFDEYNKAINFAVRVIDRELSKLLFAGKIRKNENGEVVKDEKGDKIWDYPDESCFCGNKIKYYEGNKPICENCFKNKFTENGLRKRMYSAKGRKAEHEINIKNSTSKISKTHFNYAIREAFNQYKSIKRQKQERKKRLSNERKRLQQFIEMRDGKNIVLPKREKQKALRYIHPAWKSQENSLDKVRGYTLAGINGKIKIFDRNIKREEESLKNKGTINFKAKRIMLDKSVKFIEDKKVNLSISKMLPKEYELDLPLREKRLKWLKEKIDIIKNQEAKYAYLLRRDNEFYLQYTLETFPNIKEDYSGAIGIDRGISHIAVCTFVDKNGKNDPPIFLSSSEILRLKNLQKERDKFLRGKHNKIRKKRNMRNIESMIGLRLHEYSKKIVELASKKNAFITFENLTKIKKSRYKMSKNLQYKLSLFIFKRLSDLVDYKARKEGIKVLYVPPENTSKECSHCGEKVDTQRPFNGNSSLFKCNKCNIQINADYNASINIAKKGLNIS